MGRFTDKLIRSWIKKGEHFEMRADGGGLSLCYREHFMDPVWRLRYRLGGRQTVVVLGSYRDLSLAEARAKAKELRARVAMGYDVGAEKQERIQEAVRQRVIKQDTWTVNRLADEYFDRHIKDRLKHPEVVRRQLERDIRPRLGKLAVEAVTPMQIDGMLQAILGRGAPTTANDVLRLTRKLFDYAVTRHVIAANPASAFGLGDAGGGERSRSRALSQAELTRLFEAMRNTPGFGVQNYHAFKLLLLLAVRKTELTAARVEEFDLEAGLWRLPGSRTKTEAGLAIPLAEPAMESIKELIRLGCSSPYLLPARKAQDRMLPHISESTLNVALAKVRRQLPDLAPFTVHDFRCTARTQLAALGVAAHVAERCLNHKLKGVEGVYDSHDYLSERRQALGLWAQVLGALEAGEEWTPVGGNVVPLSRVGRY